MVIRIITENQLDDFVRGKAELAQGLIVDLIYRLVAASVPTPSERRFPLGDSMNQVGPDGELKCDTGFPPFVPVGHSAWEIGTNLNAAKKATSDYNGRTKATAAAVRKKAAFIFVTPLSGRRGWKNTTMKGGQAHWINARKKRKEWADVVIVDGTKIIDWLNHFPAVAKWLARQMGISVGEITVLEEHWDLLRTMGAPPPLSTGVFLINRAAASAKVQEVFAGGITQLRLETHYPDQIQDFLAAYAASLSDEKKTEYGSKCLLVPDAKTWEGICGLPNPHVFVPIFDINADDAQGSKLLQLARNGKHSVIYWGPPGGIPEANRVSVPSPKDHELQEALEKSGYPKERARSLAQKCGGNMQALMRVIQNLSLSPEWAQGTAAAELALAALIGGWDETTVGDKKAIENILGKKYGEWIGILRKEKVRPGTPLFQNENKWRFLSRYVGWQVLSKFFFDPLLDQFSKEAVNVLQEEDPRFELKPEDRPAASLLGKTLKYSPRLRKGLAGALALLGSHPEPLTNASPGRAVSIAAHAVQQILDGADWQRWASLNDLLPLLAEASPEEFLDAVEKSLQGPSSPFKDVFKQEGGGIMGATYMSGLLWALETLAWSPDYLVRVTLILGHLAKMDPGGQFTNRPGNSLTSIYLPWLPQTCAPIPRRQTAIDLLNKELPEVAWSMLLKLLPDSHQMSMGGRRPEWRSFISEDWNDGVTKKEYWDQVLAYGDKVTSLAKGNIRRLIKLVDKLDDLPDPILDPILEHLKSEVITRLPENERVPLWESLIKLVNKHRKFPDAAWVLPATTIDKIAAAANALEPMSPVFRHKRLFAMSDFDLLDEKLTYQEREKILGERRQNAIREVMEAEGLDGVFTFAGNVPAPWQVGVALAGMEQKDLDAYILPGFIETEENSNLQLSSAYIKARYFQNKWAWVETLDLSSWTPQQKAIMYSYLPFEKETWERAAEVLGAGETLYWEKANVSPYFSLDGMEDGIDNLIRYGRAREAVSCYDRLIDTGKNPKPDLGLRLLKECLEFKDFPKGVDTHEVSAIIRWLQGNPDADGNEMFKLEWAYLPLLDRMHSSGPKILESRLAKDPDFYCELIRAVFKSDKPTKKKKKPTKRDLQIADQGYRLLRGWRIFPGMMPDKTVDEAALVDWVRKMKDATTESGHLKSAMSYLGRAFSHAPEDPSGLWINHSVAKILNGTGAEEMRDGFASELFNSRGVFTWTSGQEEKKVAAKYTGQAEKLEDSGYHRLAKSLRKLAAAYAKDAEREANRDPLEDY